MTSIPASGHARQAIVLFTVLCMPFAAAHGADSDAPTAPRYELPPIEVRATRLPDPLGPFPLAGRRLGLPEVERRPGGDLRDVLLPVAGVHISSLGAPWAGSAVSLRGSTSEQVLVLVDGRRRNPAQGGGVDLAALPLQSVESVEVFRGGASALWGSDAIGGAIHVRTRRPRPGWRRLRLESGSFGQHAAEGGGAIALGGGWRARAAGRWFEAAGDYAFLDDRRGAEGEIRNGDVRRATADARVDGQLGPFDLRMDAAALDAERGVPGSREFPSPTARLEDDRLTMGLRAADRTGAWQPALDLSFLRMKRRYREPGAAFGPLDERHRNTRVEGDASLAGLRGETALRVAAGASHDRLRSTTDGARSRPAMNARAHVSHSHRVRERTVRWMAAARLDAVDGFAPFVGPRAGVLVDALPERLSVRVSAGLSHRAPSFDELFWPPRATAAGNPDLRSERGRDLDAGVVLGGLPFSGRVSLDAFVRRVDDLIQWIPGAAGIWRPHNVGRAEFRGVEGEGDLKARLGEGFSARVSGSATLLDARDRSGEPNVDGKQLVYRPRWSGTGTLLLTHARLGELETAWRLLDDVFVTRANTKSLPGRLLGEVRWRRRFAERVTLDAAVTNVTDREARDFRHYPLPGRVWKLGLAWERAIR